MCLSIQGNSISIEIGSAASGWVLTAPVFYGAGEMPPRVRECLSSRGTLKWQEKGGFLKLDSDRAIVYLVHQTPPLTSYLAFKEHVESFLQTLQLWSSALALLGNKV